MWIMILSLLQPHLLQKCLSMCMDFFQNGLFILIVIWSFFCQQLLSQHHIFQRRILWEQIKRLKYHSKMESLFSQFSFILAGSSGGIIQSFSLYGNTPFIGCLKKIQTSQECCLAGSGRTDNSQRTSLFHGKTDIFQNLGTSKMFFDIFYFQYCHFSSPLSEIIQSFFNVIK